MEAEGNCVIVEASPGYARDRVFMVHDNASVRATRGGQLARLAAADSFPVSVTVRLPIEYEEGGRPILDASSLFPF